MEDHDVGKEPDINYDVIKLRTGMEGKGHALVETWDYILSAYLKRNNYMPVKNIE